MAWLSASVALPDELKQHSLPLLWAHFAVSLGFNLATSSLYYRISWQHKPTLLNFAPPSISPSGPHYCCYRSDLLSLCRTSAGGGGRGHRTNLLKRKWTWMSGGGASSFPVISFWSLFFSNFLHSVYFLLPHSPDLCCYPSASLSVSSRFSHIFSPGFSSWPSHTSSWCHFNNLQGVGLAWNRKCGLKSELKWVFHCRLLMFWWQNQKSSAELVLAVISVNEEKLILMQSFLFDLETSFSWPGVVPAEPEQCACSFRSKS